MYKIFWSGLVCSLFLGCNQSSTTPQSTPTNLGSKSSPNTPQTKGDATASKTDGDAKKEGDAKSNPSIEDAVARVTMARNRSVSSNNLKQMAIAFHNQSAVANHMLPAILSKEGKPLLSWRVAILPYIEQETLYKQFKLDEPWDSEHNKKLIPKMPKIYQIPGVTADEGKTFYRTFVSEPGSKPCAIFELGATGKPCSLANIVDGTSNTLLLAEANEAVTWTQPNEIVFDATKPLPVMGKHWDGGFMVALGDGSVRFIPGKTDEKVLKGMITRNGGETP